MQSRIPVHDDQKYHIVGESSENNLHFPLLRKGGIDHVYFFVNGARTQDIPLDTNHNHSLKGGMRPIQSLLDPSTDMLICGCPNNHVDC